MLPQTPFRFIWHFICKQKWAFFTGQLFCLAYCLDQTLFPVLFGRVVDIISSYHGNRLESWPIVGTPILHMMWFWISMELMYRFQGFVLARSMPRMQESMRLSLFQVVQSQSYRYFSVNFSGALTQRINDVTLGCYQVLRGLMTMIIPAFIGIVLCGIFLYRVSFYQCIIIEVWVALHTFFTIWLTYKTSHRSHDLGISRSVLAGVLVDSINNHLLVKVSAREDWELDCLKVYQTKERQKNHHVLYGIEQLRIILGFLTFLGPGLLIGASTYYEWKHALISLGDVVLIFTITWNITGLIWQIGNELPDFLTQWGIVSQGLSILKTSHEVKDLPGATSLCVKRGEIVFQDVSFGYDSDLFQDLSIKINSEEKVGLVGQSGAGKSTFVNLILRLFDVQKGSITIDGIDIRDCTQRSLRQIIAYLPQNPSQFKRRIYDNIRYSCPEATYEEVVEAAKEACIHDVIMNLPEGYDTQPENLSGGERQRIDLARVFLQAKRGAKILIIDEGTSALDPETEDSIQQSLEKLMKSKTTLVIAHRPTTIEHMDRILVFEKGKIIQER